MSFCDLLPEFRDIALTTAATTLPAVILRSGNKAARRRNNAANHEMRGSALMRCQQGNMLTPAAWRADVPDGILPKLQSQRACEHQPRLAVPIAGVSATHLKTAHLPAASRLGMVLMPS